MFDVVVIGSLNLDLVATAARLPGPGETVHGSSFHEMPGGKGLNQAVAAARAGAAVAFVGALGDDPAGDVLRAVVEGEGIDAAGLATIAGAPSGRALIGVDDAAENSIIVVAGANGNVNVDTVPQARVALAQLETNVGAVVGGLRAARYAGATTILNPAPADRAPEEVLALCDVIVPNEHEVELLGGVDRLRRLGARAVIVTRGAAGADIVTESGTEHIDAFVVEPVDTTGAGDAFCGALASRMAAGDGLAGAVRFAAAAGALATTRPGAVPSLPRRAEIEAMLDGTWEVGFASGHGSPGVPPAPHVAAIVEAYLAALSSGEPDRVAALVTDDFVNEHTAALGAGSVGRNEYRQRLPGFFASFPGLRYDIEQVIAHGTSAAVSYRMTATSDGSPIDIRGVMIVAVRDGLVAQRTDYWDALTYLRQTDGE